MNVYSFLTNKITIIIFVIILLIAIGLSVGLYFYFRKEKLDLASVKGKYQCPGVECDFSKAIANEEQIFEEPSFIPPLSNSLSIPNLPSSTSSAPSTPSVTKCPPDKLDKKTGFCYDTTILPKDMCVLETVIGSEGCELTPEYDMDWKCNKIPSCNKNVCILFPDLANINNKEQMSQLTSLLPSESLCKLTGINVAESNNCSFTKAYLDKHGGIDDKGNEVKPWKCQNRMGNVCLDSTFRDSLCKKRPGLRCKLTDMYYKQHPEDK